ncbi:MAG TPA: DinB family protein [Saprospiraceae bacterium]|nr:DinB family protein [Saprospiraceae bacterium]MCB9270802.1 DinB family protein [Lewinellaceae bacterium]HPG05828.1 DinB family protein [Saprospiraceae bacterium]HQU52612.1 DinB family protein [Saprospiraceae bacterium]HRV85793.1 DinB family protein [Saprospiraceae bacterium]
MAEFENLYELHMDYTGRFMTTLNRVSADLAEATPASGWSLLQIFDHVIQVESTVFPFITTGAVQQPRTNWETRRLLKAMVNRSFKVNSPKSFLPKSLHTWTELHDQWLGSRMQLEQLLSAGRLCFDGQEMVHPILGTLTRLDWFYVYYFHGERHRLQMEEVIGRLTGI